MIRFNNISKTFRHGGIECSALCEVSGEINTGEMVALCGPSGSGKSTLLNILGVLDTDYTGEIYLNQRLLSRDSELATQVRRSQLGFVFQRFNLIAVMTVLENIIYPLQLHSIDLAESRQKGMAMLEKVGLAGFEHYRPEHLSGGQQQRVAIARALILQPTLVIADEPTANLDSATAVMMIDLMHELGELHNTTFLIATHDPAMASRCDRIITIKDGSLVATGSKAAEVCI